MEVTGLQHQTGGKKYVPPKMSDIIRVDLSSLRAFPFRRARLGVFGVHAAARSDSYLAHNMAVPQQTEILGLSAQKKPST